jgi:glucose-1-phosphate adenylyltransferase
MLKDGCKMVAYNFDSYWKDVGTIDSLWEANMDLLNPKVPLDLYDPNWRVYSRTDVMPPHYCGDNCTIENSMISEGCNIDGKVDSSILFAGVTIEKGAAVNDSIIMPNSYIKSGAVIQYAIVGEDTVIGENARIGDRPEKTENKDNWGVAVIGHGVKVEPKAVVPPKAMIDKNK